MDFTVAIGAPAPLVIRINGTEYKVPRFLLPAFKEWAARRSKEQLDASMAIYDDPKNPEKAAQEKARFRLFYTAAPQDMAVLADELRSPEGVEYVLRTCLPTGNVPPEVVDSLIAGADPIELRLLSDQLASVRNAVAQMKANSGEGEGDEKNPPASSGQA